MLENFEVKIDKLKNYCKIDSLEFNDTSDLEPLHGIIGQKRASKSLDFGLSIQKKGYNVFVSGQSGTGRNSYVKLIADEKAGENNIPDDWLYVYNFENPHNPTALNMKPGDGKHFKEEVDETIKTLKREVENLFASKDHENLRNALYQQFSTMTADTITELNKIAEKYDFRFTQTEKGLMSIPLRDGKTYTEEDYKGMSPKEFEELKDKNTKLSLESFELFNTLRELEKEYRKKLKALDGEAASRIVNSHIYRLNNTYGYNQPVTSYLEALSKDIITNIQKFRKPKENNANPFAMFKMNDGESFFKRYNVNLFIDNSCKKKAPVIYLSNPTYYNLVGSVEYSNEMGVMRADFMQIKPGALHEANGGFLIIQAKDVLSSPFAWSALKRGLNTGKINIEGLGKQLGYVVTTTLKPQAIPLDIKIILIGDAYTYYLLYNYDEDFRKLFKIMADFDIEMKRSEENLMKMARFIATHCEKEKLKHFSKEAVAKVIDFSSRLAANQDKLSSKFNQIVEILYEADVWATKDDSKVVKVSHIDKAIEEKNFRNNKYEEKVMEMFESGDYIIDVDGKKTGEINGLAVTGTGEYSFGKPSKITVSTFKGKSGIINIEREAKTSGKIHDKGVMIISGYIGHKFAQDTPLSLSASIVFEQLYSGVDGDSASSTELYALLSSLADVPIKQYIAVTGSVNQRGEIQPIGGVNEKIEGFYKVCKLKGLNGKQGVMIPHQNVKNLMLSEEVIESIKKKEFRIYSVKDIEEGIEILTDRKAGVKMDNGKYPDGTINSLVSNKLNKFYDSDDESDKEKDKDNKK